MCAIIRGIVCSWAFGALHAQMSAKVEFARDVQPIFREHCVECHGPSQQMRGLRLDRRRDVLPNRVGANGARIVPGSSTRSPLFRRVSATEPGQVMPPTGAMPPEKVAVLKAWIEQGADWPDELSGDRDSRTADPAVLRIQSALRNGDRQEFARAVSERPEAVQAKGPNGWTPLMYAALYGDADGVRLLLEKGAKPNAQNDDGGTALMYATNDEAKTKLLLEHGANPNLRSSEGRTALLVAARRSGSYGVVKLLLEGGADASARLPDGRSALVPAVFAGDLDVIQLLVARGAAKGPVPLGPALLNCAACFDFLLPLAAPGDLAGALQGSVRAGDLPRIDLLLGKGARPAANLLQVVSLVPEIPAETIQRLIRSGADVQAKTSTGVTVAEFARRQGNATLLRALDEAPAASSVPTRQGKATPSARAAVERVIPALQRADVAFLDKAGCVSCHNNSLTAMTLAAARVKRLPFDERIAKNQLRRIAEFLEANAERALQNEGLPGGVDTASYILLGLAAGGYPSDPITDAWARHVRNSQSADGRFRCAALRPPLESSDFEVTAASIRALRTYGSKSQRADFDQAVARGVKWLEAARPSSNEDRAFQILGLIWGGGNRRAIQAAAQELLAQQRPDGGWRQIPTIATDAYATGQALAALHESGVPIDHPAHRRGVQYLLRSQLEDGSWRVVSRAAAIQPYFDSDFPHGPDQFISAAASNWAAMALIPAVR